MHKTPEKALPKIISHSNFNSCTHKCQHNITLTFLTPLGLFMSNQGTIDCNLARVYIELLEWVLNVNFGSFCLWIKQNRYTHRYREHCMTMRTKSYLQIEKYILAAGVALIAGMSLKCKFALFLRSKAKGQINNKRQNIKIILIIVVVIFFKGFSVFVKFKVHIKKSVNS